MIEESPPFSRPKAAGIPLHLLASAFAYAIFRFESHPSFSRARCSGAKLRPPSSAFVSKGIERDGELEIRKTKAHRVTLNKQYIASKVYLNQIVPVELLEIARMLDNSRQQLRMFLSPLALRLHLIIKLS